MNIYFLFIDHRKDFVEWVGRVALVRFVFHHERILERERERESRWRVFQKKVSTKVKNDRCLRRLYFKR